ncbi:hypothetical protein R1sor_027533 [Riccia sorocarpa]|uniref:Uncharacterized protein n=1 Tax=Riccia sorocarpa TaxID=122646 RepID=A0ABD3GHM3_9MARC
MSIATAFSSLSAGGCLSSATRTFYQFGSTHQCSGCREANPRQRVVNSLSASWNGLAYRGTLFSKDVTDHTRLIRFVAGSAVALARPPSGLPALRPSGYTSSPGRGGRLVQNPSINSFAGSPLPASSALIRSRIAYGYYLGPAYGYGGGFGFGGGSIFLLLILGFLAVQAFTRTSENGLLTSGREKVSVLKLQVGLLGIARNLQRDLERIADRADTSTARGLHYVLTETVLALLRQPDMCILGTSSTEGKRSIEAGERRFNQLSLEERGKFDEETLVNVDGNRKNVDRGRNDGFGNEYIVVTVLVAAEGEYKLPSIYSNSDMREALKTLGSIPADRLQGVEILWTPQDRNDTLSERDLLRNYPLLKSL